MTLLLEKLWLVDFKFDHYFFARLFIEALGMLQSQKQLLGVKFVHDAPSLKIKWAIIISRSPLLSLSRNRAKPCVFKFSNRLPC